jgi:UDP-glucuronate 4-epimerase
MSPALLITGANGYLGSHCVERYSQTSETEVIAVWQSNKDRLLVSPPSNVHYVQCDLTDQLAVQELFSRWKIDRVFHAAALLPDQDPDFLHRAIYSNIVATANLVECATKAGCRRFVYCSSISVYGSAPCSDNGWEEDSKVAPSCIYGLTKYAGEECLRIATSLSELKGVSLRLAGIHGRGRYGGVVYNLMKDACDGKPLTINNPNNRFQLLFIDDAIEFTVRALESAMQQPYRCFNTASHVFPSTRFMAEQIIALCRSKSQILPSFMNTNKESLMNTNEIIKELSYRPKALRDCLNDFFSAVIL